MRFLVTYRKVLAMLHQDGRLAVILVFANIFVAALQFLEPVLFGNVIGLLSLSDQVSGAELWSRAARLLGLWALVGGVGIIANVMTVVHAERMSHRNRLTAMSRYYEHVLSLPLSFHGDAHSGRLMKVMLTGADALFSLWLAFFRDQCSTFIAAGVLLPLTLFMNWRLSLVLIVLVIVFCALAVIVIDKTEHAQQRVEDFQSQLAGTAQDAFANVMVVQSFTRLSAETRLFGDIVDQLIHNQFPVLNWWAVVNVLTRASSTVAVILIVIIGTWLHVQGKATVGEIVAFMGFATLLIGRLEGAMNFASRLFFYLPGLEEFFSVIEAESSVPEKPQAAPLRAERGEVEFKDVVFAYPGGPNILAGINFKAPPGSVFALVGHTGSGKSTAMNLLQRLWDPVSGQVLIDGQDLRDVTLESLRQAIGVVFQESMLFNRSISDNLRIGKPEATLHELHEACRLADAHDFIMRQPQGYDTTVGERGATLSGGQRQRLSIARALLKNPPILILDEATSALDAATEARVSKAMGNLMKGRTTFIIAHRLSTVRDADVIMVFEHGQIAERGSFDELLAMGGRFAKLVETQLATMPAPKAAAAPGPSVPSRIVQLDAVARGRTDHAGAGDVHQPHA